MLSFNMSKKITYPLLSTHLNNNRYYKQGFYCKRKNKVEKQRRTGLLADLVKLVYIP
jgi:hypothetical protein